MANISQNVNIEMLEKLPDGTYKRKYPKTRADDGTTFDEHLAEKATQNEYGHIRLQDIPNPQVATQAEAELGTNNTKMMTPLRVGQAIDSKVRVVDNGILEVFVSGEWVTFADIRMDDIWGAPGSNMLIAGTMDEGFFGEVPANQLITGDALASQVGISAGTSQFSSEGWLKFAYRGKILFVAKKPIRYSISWNRINNANCIYGDKTVTIGRLTFKVRLMTGGNGDPASASGGEWNQLMYGVTINQEPNWGAYTGSDLLTSSSFGSGSYSWCQEVHSSNSSSRVRRGGASATYFSNDSASNSATQQGWRPVLELVEED